MKLAKGFTKKEVVVIVCCVVFLIANLGAIGAHGRRRAKETLCLSNLRQWGVMWQMYTGDNNGYFHLGRYGTSGVNTRCWVYVLQDYHDKNQKIRCCPEATTPFVDKNGDATGARNPFAAWGMIGPWWTGGGIKDQYYYGSYGIEDHICNRDWRNPDGSFSNWRHTNHSGADRIPVMTSCYFITGWLLTGSQSSALVPPEYDGHIWDNPSGNAQMTRFCHNRHGGHTNALFMDWSVRNVGLKELWTLRWSPLFDTENAWTLAGNGGDYEVTYQKWADWGDGWLTDFKLY